MRIKGLAEIEALQGGGSLLPGPLLGYDTEVEEVGDVVLVDVSGGLGSEVGVGLVLTYVPYVDEIPIGEGGLLV